MRLVAVAGIVYLDIAAAELLYTGRDGGFDIGLLGDIGNDGNDVVAEFLGNALSADGIAVDDNDLGAACDEAFRNALTEARTRAGDESDFTF